MKSFNSPTERRETRLVSRICFSALAAVALVNVTSVSSAREQESDRFEPDIKAYEEKDKTTPPPADGTEFVGSSSITKWKQVDEDFKEFKAFNRGFGGSTIPEVNHYFDRIVLKYKPKRIVFYAGTNDVADDHSAVRVEHDFETFAEKVRKALPQTDVYFISMSVAPSRLKWQSVYDEGNKLVKGYISKTPHFHYIDVTPVMKSSDGKLKPVFLADQLHMTREGYELWIPIIRNALKSDDAKHG